MNTGIVLIKPALRDLTNALASVTEGQYKIMEKDIFGFADAIALVDLNDEQLKIVELIFKDFK